ncbi:L,D-transpeptidase family protein [Mucilaginibacter calamicampi]|uniref:L,D-transpeptidase family protein n=1 Tax=Mucilaginibacter calamicampi TaxID=1302352 RepID=A0ABW2YV61_9SPHI
MKKAVLFFLLIFTVLKINAQIKPCGPPSIALQAQLKNTETVAKLNFPKTTWRFYSEKGFASAWLNNGTEKKAWQALLFIDCVLQYGLAPADYHPKELLYDKLQVITETPDKVDDRQKAQFDIMLTDAMLSIINHLHYGKLNPEYSQAVIENGVSLPFYAEKQLLTILMQPDITEGVLGVQPASKLYSDLQYKMRQLKGQYDGDCYTVPEETIRKIAINMERIRWAVLDDNAPYVHINIPSFKLGYHSPQLDKEFKVIVGSASTPTPVLQSNIEYFTTAPEWKIPNSIFTKEILRKAVKNPAYLAQNNYTLYNHLGAIQNPDQPTLKSILKAPKGYYAKQSAGCDNALGVLVFRFKNIYSVYLHDTPDKNLFNRTKRDLSHGCIRIEHPEVLAELLLKNDQQEKKVNLLKKNIATQKCQNFTLNKPLPIKITYLTCTINDGELVTYSDVYGQDKSLEMALYNVK